MNVRTSVAAISLLCCFATMVVAQSKETMRYTGRVIAVEADSITVARDTNRVFVVDESTEVKGKGVDGRSGEITDFVGEKDSVTVTYEDLGDGSFLALEVEIHVKHKQT